MITVTATDGLPPYNYSWTPAVSTSNVATGLAPGTYSVQVIDANGCETTATASITQPNALSVSGSVMDASCGLSDGEINLAVSGGNEPYNFVWSPTGGTGANATGLALGEYTVTVIDANGCSVTADFTVGTTGTFYLEAFPADTTIDLGDWIDIDVDIDPNVVVDQITWSPVDGLSCDDCLNPIATPEETTVYIIQVETADGCVATDTVVVNVIVPCGEFFVPNMFSPNSDGINDKICAMSNCVQELTWDIFNRWGELVFRADETVKCWDGNARNGQPVQAGVYVYKLRAVMTDGEVIEKSGNITVVR